MPNRVSPAEHKRRMEAYEQTNSDRAAAEMLGINQATFSMWRRSNVLTGKGRQRAIATTRRHLDPRQARYVAARLEHGLAQLRDRLNGDAFAQLIVDGLMMDVDALVAAVGGKPDGDGTVAP